MEEYGILTDPFGLPIIIATELCVVPEPGKGEALYNDYRTVIERPAFIIEIETGTPTRYYFRSIGWETTLLIRTEYYKGQWLANQCSKNPSDTYLKNLATQGRPLSTSPFES